MNAFLIHDRIEHNKAKAHQADAEKQKWIDDRANELLKLYPLKLVDFASVFTLPFELRSHFYQSKADEAYSEFFHTLAWQQAEDDWELAFGWAAAV